MILALALLASCLRKKTKKVGIFEVISRYSRMSGDVMVLVGLDFRSWVWIHLGLEQCVSHMEITFQHM